MDLTQLALTIIVAWAAMGALFLLGFYFGLKAGYREGTAYGLDLAWQRVESDETPTADRRDHLEPQPLAIRYSMLTGGGTTISGRLVLDDMTRADWTNPDSHHLIRTRLCESFPGCEVIGYAVIDRRKETN